MTIELLLNNILTILPPLISLILAVWKRNILLSLIIGNFVGFVIISGFLAPIEFLKESYFQLIKPSHYQVIIIMLIIAGFVELLDKSGGANAFANRMTKWVNTKSKAMLSTMFTGIAIFFTDSGNSLILGPLYRPIYDKLNICREKLAYILDSTSSPVCILIPFISWGLYIMGLIEDSFISNSVTRDSFDTYISLYKFQFYPILTLVFGILISWWGKDFGIMKKYQEKSEFKHDLDTNTLLKATKVRFVLLPLGLLLILMIIGFILMFSINGKITGPFLRLTLISSYLLSTLFLCYELQKHKISSFAKSKSIVLSGIKNMLNISAVLVMAWLLSHVCSELGTVNTLSSLLKDSVTGLVLPALIFTIGVLASFATGSSWGTMAIIMPLAIGLGVNLDANLELTIAAVLSGALFGDHTSPISDTTLLASIASECEHIDHVKSQLGYAIIPGSLSFILFLLVGLFLH
jgi:Na+/H+ antiporter NhaC